MAQPAFQLNDVRVAAPCPVSWEEDLTLELSGDVVVVGLIDSRPSIIDKTPGSFTISGDLLIRLPH
jgi:hypothetical protein